VKVRKIIKFEFEGGHDIEFIQSDSKAAVFEVWVDGVFVEEMGRGDRPSEARAWYYFEVHCPELEKSMVEQTEDSGVRLAAAGGVH
jgi:hypothetical protein